MGKIRWACLLARALRREPAATHPAVIDAVLDALAGTERPVVIAVVDGIRSPLTAASAARAQAAVSA